MKVHVHKSAIAWTFQISSAKLPYCLAAWVKLRTIFDIPALNAKIQDLEQVASVPEFWEDQEEAQKTLQELGGVKDRLSQYHQWQAGLEDAKAVLELLELENDESLLAEAQTNLCQLNRELDL